MNINKAVFVFAVALLCACAGHASKPVEFAEGDQCSFCKMAISEKQFAAELLDHDGEALKFDDIGCMRNYIKKHPIHPAAIFVIDFDSKEWLDGKKAFYVRSQKFQTPMGGQMTAYRTEQNARNAINKYQGELIQLW